MIQKGLLHIYTGDGKGKTTAAIGQSIRAAGNGMRVYFVQFLKDGTSSEIPILENIPGVSVTYAAHNYGFYKNMTDEEKTSARDAYGNLLSESIQMITQTAESTQIAGNMQTLESIQAGVLLVLDEIIGAYNHNLIEKELLIHFLRERASNIEVILTGREPAMELLELADYVTEMKKIRHPFDGGVPARKGIEY